jgi:hypothetical protein
MSVTILPRCERSTSQRHDRPDKSAGSPSSHESAIAAAASSSGLPRPLTVASSNPTPPPAKTPKLLPGEGS